MSTDRLTGAACARPENKNLPWISERATSADMASMRRVCAACPVAAACAREVATTETTAGFWAGHDRTETDLPEQGTLLLDLGAGVRRFEDPHDVVDLGDGWVLADPDWPDGPGTLARVVGVAA